ncbi:hypothetical protein BGZ99_004133 [Dissophora globulifera]|uniref:UNC-45/Cro1/She4 central domain-containing protein n=1 Tax=Dissophora globulifera TaxID=979702 RepID=A0A9P6UVH8_9FUNG|nr:hypothetical protein BGZ99_004133 [Dissophora globulifera]
MSDTIEDLLRTLSTTQDIQPTQISDLSTALISALADASSDDTKKTVRTQQQEFLEQCASILSKQPSLSGDSAAEADDLITQVQSAVLKSLLRMVMNDTPFADALIDSNAYPSILRLPSLAPTVTKIEPAAKTPTTESGKRTRVDDFKPMVAIVLAKVLEMTSNKDHVRDRSTEIVLTDIGSDKVKIRATGFQALALIIQADLSIGCGILGKEGLLVEVMDCIELEPESTQIILTETLSMACADAKGRTVVGLHCSEFLKSIVLRGATKNQHLKGAAAVALTKISLADSRKDPSTGLNGVSEASQGGDAKPTGNNADEEAQLAKLFSTLLKDDRNDNNSGIQLNAVEGLAYASIQPAVKQLIISDKALLLSLFQLGEDTKNSPLKYGLIIIFNNLTAFRKRLTPEQEQMLKLKKMAGTLPKSESRRLQSMDEDDPLDDEAVVNQRNITLVKLGIMPALHAIGAQASENIKQSLAQVLRNLATPPETRGLLVQQGIVRLLMPLASQQAPKQQSTSESAKTAATQALAKLSITLDPRLTFKNQRIPELVKPLIWLLDSTDQLCQFESLMALTNLGSMGDEQVLGLIVQDGGVEKMENLQFSEHVLVRRAATEALCNMIFFEPVFEMYSDPKKSKSKIHLMLALCDAEDFMTRRAASGALAVLSTSLDVCNLIMSQERGLEILTSLITLGVPTSSTDAEEVEAKAIEDVMSDQDTVVDHAVAVGRMDELRHRGAECFKNLVSIGGLEISQKIAKRGAVQQLANLIKSSSSEAVQYCAMEALKAMSEQGVKLTA